MGKPKTHTRIDITIPIDMAKELRKKKYGKISQFIAKAVNERMERQMRQNLLKRGMR